MKPARHPYPRLLSPVLLLLLVSFGVHSSGCGGQAPKHTSPHANNFSEAAGESSDSEFAADNGHGADSKSRIARLFNEIGDARVRIDLPREPGGDDIAEVEGRPMTQSEELQPAARPKSKTCKEICRISEKICGNAELICELSDELGGDPWAMDKCDSGKASCNEASKRCNSCVVTE